MSPIYRMLVLTPRIPRAWHGQGLVADSTGLAPPWQHTDWQTADIDAVSTGSLEEYQIPFTFMPPLYVFATPRAIGGFVPTLIASMRPYKGRGNPQSHLPMCSCNSSRAAEIRKGSP